jgi:hypothetical protein
LNALSRLKRNKKRVSVQNYGDVLSTCMTTNNTFGLLVHH